MQYSSIEKKLEWRKLIKKLIPSFFILIVRKAQYKRRYPHSFVSADSKVLIGAQIGDDCLIRETTIHANTEIGNYTTTGPGTRFGGLGKITIGKFCSIGPECFFWSENHALENVSAYPFETVLAGKQGRYVEYKGEDISVGHDVWVGQRSIVLAGARIGHGCVIAAGSVLPRGDYPPYSLIGGNPARVIKQRFNQATVDELLSIAWWEMPPEELFEKPMMDFLHQKQVSK